MIIGNNGKRERERELGQYHNDGRVLDLVKQTGIIHHWGRGREPKMGAAAAMIAAAGQARDRECTILICVRSCLSVSLEHNPKFLRLESLHGSAEEVSIYFSTLVVHNPKQ